jgi:hypothetical protein
VTRTLRKLLPTAALGIVASAAIGGIVAGPASAANAAEPTSAPTTAAAPARVLPHNTQLQTSYYNCGPTAARNALVVHDPNANADQLARQLGTTTDGTNSAADITRVLNAHLGAGRYTTTMINGEKASPAQLAKLQSDVVGAVTKGDAVVANVAGTVTDTAGETHSYEGGHYLAVVGYGNGGNTVTIADSADTVGSPDYTLTITQLGNWIATRGYAS